MSAASDYLENKVLDHTLGTTSLTLPASWIALYTDDPTDADVGTEVAGGSYSREAATYNAAAAASADNDVAIEFTKATGNWGTITHIGIRDASSGGNLMFHGILSASVVINTDDIFRIPISNLTVTAA